jgi:Lipid-binding putative hydrolase
MKNITTILISSLSMLFFLISCDKKGFEDYEIKGNANQELSGEWFINIINAKTGDVEAEHILHKTYELNNKLFIDDLTEGLTFKGSLNTNPTSLTFEATNAANLYTQKDTTFTVTEGKVLKNAAKSKDKNVVDSIYFKIKLSNIPDEEFILSGHRRSGFREDEY